MAPIENYSDAKSHTCCFTGHRPQKLTRPEQVIRSELHSEIEAVIREGYSTFITGMAYGVDIWAGEIVADLRQTNPTIKLIAAIPFPGFEKSWSSAWRQRFDSLLLQADQVYNICDRYCPTCYQRRNEWMVNQSGKIIAAYNGSRGGTQNTVKYAMRYKIQIQFLNA